MREYSYKPTKVERKLLEALLKPELVGANVTQICREAGISRQRYYRIMKKTEFVELVNQMTKDLIGDKIFGVLQASYLNALDPKGFQDRKMLLQMYEMYVDKLEYKGTIDTRVEQVLSDEELKARIAELEEELQDDDS